ncbi:MAG: MerR family transcriptional regulator [Alistipes sp.]|nr:MerR family transcriptional regulator [Alistipes sp.]
MNAKKLYYSMGEVAEMFDVTPALIRHWESQFDCLKPDRNKKGNRLFTPEDVEKLKQIYHLVKERGMTLKGANVMLKRVKNKEIAREVELLERLQRVRSTLAEVRENLKEGDEAQMVEDDALVEEAAPLTATTEEAVEAAAAETTEAAEAVEASAEENTPAEESAPEAEPTTEPTAEEPEAEPTTEAAAEESVPAVEQPKKRVVRRRKKSDEEDKELFPFYEQSLF